MAPIAVIVDAIRTPVRGGENIYPIEIETALASGRILERELRTWQDTVFPTIQGAS